LIHGVSIAQSAERRALKKEKAKAGNMGKKKLLTHWNIEVTNCEWKNPDI